MPRGRPGERYQSWLMGKKEELRKLGEERVKLLPPNLQEEIIEACQTERERLLARIEVIEGELETLDGLLAEAKETKREAALIHQPPARKRIGADGSVRTVQPRGGRVKGKASIEAGKTVRRIRNHMAAFEEEKRGRRRQLREVARIEQAAEQGVVTALLQITRKWRGQIGITDLQPKVPMGGSRYCDRFGYPLPAEALDPDGEPHDFGTAAEAQAEAGRPLTVGEEVRYGDG